MTCSMPDDPGSGRSQANHPVSVMSARSLQPRATEPTAARELAKKRRRDTRLSSARRLGEGTHVSYSRQLLEQRQVGLGVRAPGEPARQESAAARLADAPGAVGIGRQGAQLDEQRVVIAGRDQDPAHAVINVLLDTLAAGA